MRFALTGLDVCACVHFGDLSAPICGCRGWADGGLGAIAPWLENAWESGFQEWDNGDNDQHKWGEGCTVGQYERLIMMAEDELTQYSTDARKIQKLRQKIGLSVSVAEQNQVKEQLLAEIPTDPINKLIADQRQTVALPFWGIAGLGLLLGISMLQPLDLIATVGGGAIAIALQRYGWKLQAKRFVLQTLLEMEADRTAPKAQDAA